MDSMRSMNLEKFDGNNFRQWKFQIKCALKAKGIDISVPKPSENSVEWTKNDGMAMFIITSSMDFKQITLIENCETAMEIMTKLESIYEQKSELCKMLIHEKFYQYKMSTNDGVAQHISKVESLAKQLKESGESVSEMAVITKILGTLPHKYRSLRQAWMSLDPTQQTLVNLTARLLDEEASLQCEEEQETALLVANKGWKKNPKQREPNRNTSSSNQNNTAKHRFECYNCGKRGHFSRECRAPKKSKNRKPQQEGADLLAFNVESSLNKAEENAWILDSGASAHMTYRKEFFIELFECNQKLLTLGNKQSMEVAGVGKVIIKRYVNGQWENSELHDVLYVPNLRRNLFSEGVIMRKSYTIIKKGSSALIYKNNNLVMCASITENNLYELKIKAVVPDTCNLVQSDQDNMKMWHERLGHVNLKQIKNMNTNNVVEGLKVNNSDKTEFVCEACAYGKQCRFPFHKSVRGELQPGDLVYSDVCGPMSHTSIQGMRYFLLFKDAASSYRHVYFIKHKSDVMEIFKKYNSMIKNKYMHSVRILHTDNGREYVNKTFKDYLSKEGIVHECTAPYTPEQNGRAERENRTIVESARSMLYARDVSLDLWAEAVNCAVYLLNRTSSSQTPQKTPFELWNGIKPNVGHVRVFGSTGYVHIPDQLRTKFEKKSEKMILVGYDNNNYRMFNPETKKVKISRNVIFDEHNIPERRENITQIYIDDEEKTLRQENNISATNAEDTLVDISSSENEDSMLSCGSNDPPYEPSQELDDDLIQGNVNLRPRRNRLFEANLVELSLPQTYDEAMKSPHRDNWLQAINEELLAHKENNTWTPVERSSQRTLTTKWVFAIKKDDNDQVKRFKARLCARGFNQIKDIDYQEIFSPTTRYDSIRIILSIAAKYNLEIQQFDVKTAFLNGYLDENIFIEVPEGISFEVDCVLKLNKSLYGLKQASRCWNRRFTEFLVKYGFVQSQADSCVYVGIFDGVKVFIIIYVDDALVVSSCSYIIKRIMESLKQTFKIKILKLKYFVGMEIEKVNNCIRVHQRDYIEQIINKYCMSDSNPASTPADVNVVISKKVDESIVNFPYREAVGSLLFLSSVSRPDISFAVNVLSRYVNNPSQQHVNAIKRVIRYLINTKDLYICYGESSDLTGYSDSDFAGDVDTRKSTTGYIFNMNGGPITWCSQKQKTIALSTTEAEFVAACEAAKEILWLQQLLLELGENVKYVSLYVDNQSAIKLISNPVYHKKTKHIDVKFNFIREKVELGIIKLNYIPSNSQLADMLTKALPTQAFMYLRNQILCIK